MEGNIMWKFAVVKVKENEETIIQFCNSKDEAMQSGADYFEKLPKGDGVVSVEEVELDCKERPIGGLRVIHHVWY